MSPPEETHFNGRFDALEERVDRLEQKVEGIAEKINNLHNTSMQWVNDMFAKINQLSSEQTLAMHTAMAEAERRILDRISAENKALNEKLDTKISEIQIMKLKNWTQIGIVLFATALGATLSFIAALLLHFIH